MDLAVDLVGGGWKLADLFDFGAVRSINPLLTDFFPSVVSYGVTPLSPPQSCGLSRDNPGRKWEKTGKRVEVRLWFPYSRRQLPCEAHPRQTPFWLIQSQMINNLIAWVRSCTWWGYGSYRVCMSGMGSLFWKLVCHTKAQRISRTYLCFLISFSRSPDVGLTVPPGRTPQSFLNILVPLVISLHLVTCKIGYTVGNSNVYLSPKRETCYARSLNEPIWPI